MKYSILIFLFFSVVFNSQELLSNEIYPEPKTKEEPRITINTEPAFNFCNIMNYLQGKSEKGFICKNDDKAFIKDNYFSNLNDKKLQGMIDSLLSLPVYNAISEVSKIYNKNGLFAKKGKKTYIDAFNNLPFHCVPMNGGRPNSWVEYWNEGNHKKMHSIIEHIQKNEEQIIETAIARCKQFLPNNYKLSIGADIYIAFDGNRGSFQKNQMIVIDLMNKELLDTTLFHNVLTHELHHRLYSEWLNNNFFGKKKRRINKTQLLQKSMILEGIAQQYTISNYNSQAIELLNNKELMKEIYDEWILITRKINSSSFPKIASAKVYKNQFHKEILWLNKFCTKPIEEETVKYRPSVIYYISYHLYNTIYTKTGLTGLSYVIENPDQLLKEYNRIHTEDMLIPIIPDDIIIQWSNNLK